MRRIFAAALVAVLAFLAVLAGLVVGKHQTAKAVSAAPIVYGAPGSVWRTPIPANVALDSRSDGAVAELVTEAKASGGTAYVNTTKYTSPILRATATTPRVPVYIGRADGTQDNSTNQIQATMQPGPPGALTGVPDPYAIGWTLPYAGDTDYEYAAYCADCASPDGAKHGYVWEMWRFNLCDPTTTLGAAGLAKGYWWCARWGGRDAGVQESPGYPTNDLQGMVYPGVPDPFTQTTKAARFENNKFLATATSLPLTAGEITAADLESGSINHALGASVIYPVKSSQVWPAQRNDGWASASHAVIEGMHFQLDPTFDCQSISDTRQVARMVCVALQKYGVILWDKAGAFTFRAEPAVRSEPVWGGLVGSQALQGIPWSRLRLLKPGSASAPYPTG